MIWRRGNIFRAFLARRVGSRQYNRGFLMGDVGLHDSLCQASALKFDG